MFLQNSCKDMLVKPAWHAVGSIEMPLLSTGAFGHT